MDTATVTRIIRDIIATERLSCELVLVQADARTWRVTVRGSWRQLVSFDVPKGTPAHVHDVVRAQLDMHC